MKIFIRTALTLVVSLGICSAAEKPFVPLFDGKTLNGWEVCNGFAKYEAKDGMIVGTTAKGSPNSFLCTTREYGDFLLEFETKTDPALNSGVQLRAHRYASPETVMTFTGKEIVQRKHPAGRVYGYQVEISNEERGNSGGIYDEARRGWLDETSSKPACRAAFKDNQWNRYRVVAIGDFIKTWVNGVPCADLVDSQDLTGFLALQVHAYKGSEPKQVRFRNIRIQDLGRHVWKPAWDGKTFDNWTRTGGGSWNIEDGALHAASVAGDQRVGFLMSDTSYGDVTARLRFKIERGNSGFFLRTDPKTMAAYEVEIDAQKRTGGFWDTGGRKWVTGPEDNAAVKKGEWNELTASLHGHRIVFQVNGIKTVDLPDDVQGRLEGRLALQVHGRFDTEIRFKDIEILAPQK